MPGPIIDLLAERDQLLKTINRWSSELRSNKRSTMACGIGHKCLTTIDKILRRCAEIAIAVTGPAGVLAVRVCAAGKRPSAMTMGQRTQILINLNRELARVLFHGSNDVVLSMEDMRLLETIVGQRNEFTHPSSDTETVVPKLLSLARRFCALELIPLLASANASVDHTIAAGKEG